MIIDWTYGAIAQLQGYFTTAIAINNSSIAPVEVGVVGCLKMIITDRQPKITFASRQPKITFASRQPKITFADGCPGE
ncbi:hypothetical protein KAR91_55395 [Candidatus Pacearchaeota archaeon]|nr:hypothetical protein [Candidatus Pacearchaeota archaeon]